MPVHCEMTRDAYVAQNIGRAMREEGSHAAGLARLEREWAGRSGHPLDVKRLEAWSWTNNPFTGTKEFQGMVVLMSLLNNWDLKDDNNKILYVPATDGGQAELRYIISDLGATFGKTGGVLSHNRNAPEDFVKSKFVEGVEGNRVRFAYGGKNAGLFKNISVADTKWIANWLSQLSDQQLNDAFRAANYSPEEIEFWTRALKARIDQLVKLQG